MSFVSISPDNNAVDVTVNSKIEIEFSKDLKTDLVNRNTIIVLDDVAQRIINASYSVSGAKVTILPQRVLETHTVYKVYIIGADDETAPFPLTFADDTTLATSLEFQFKTGEGYDSKDGEVNRADTKDSVEDYPTIPEGTTDLSAFMESSTGASEFEVVSQYPMTGDISVRVDQAEIRIGFSHEILGYGDPGSPSTDQADLNKILTISQAPLLDEYMIFDPVGKKFFEPVALGETQKAEYQAPSGSVSIDEKDVVFTLDAGQMWNANTIIEVQVSPDIVGDVDGVPTIFSVATRTYRFSTEIYPAYSSTNSIRYRLGGLSGAFSDIAIQAAILYASVEAFNYSRCTIGLYDPPYIARVYAEMAATLSLMNRNTLSLELGRGKSMELGDLKVAYQSPRSDADIQSGTKTMIEDALPLIIEQLAMLGGSGGHFKVGVMGINSLHPLFRQRNWDIVGKHNWANTIEDRALQLSTTTPRLVLNRF
jgi:hypothetical protein